METEQGQPAGVGVDPVQDRRPPVRDDAVGKRAADLRAAGIALAATLFVVALFSFYYLHQLDGLRRLQTDTIDRNRRESLQLIRVQNDLNLVGHALRDMLEDRDGYGIGAWRTEFRRLRIDFEDALSQGRVAEQRQHLEQALVQFWRTADQVFQLADEGQQARARGIIVDSLQAQQASLSNTVARLLVANNEAEEAAAREISAIYDGSERNVYLFMLAMLASITAIALTAAHYNRRLIRRVEALSQQRSTLARRLIGVQEEVFKSVARELHDDFGQILTAVGLMLRRGDVGEVKQVVQEALEKTRAFSQALHPTIIDDYGIDAGIERLVQTWSRQTGIPVDYQREGKARLAEGNGIHVYRIAQEALNNIAKHASATEVEVRLDFDPGVLRMRIADDGVGIGPRTSGGLGLTAMRERAQLIHASISISRRANRGTLVQLEVPTE